MMYSKEQQTKRQRRVPTQKQRNEFPTGVRKEVKEHFENHCGHCGRRCEKGGNVHHVWPRGRGGRGVFTNGILLCVACHNEAHGKNGSSLMNYYIQKFTELYGEKFYYDKWDFEQERGNENV